MTMDAEWADLEAAFVIEPPAKPPRRWTAALMILLVLSALFVLSSCASVRRAACPAVNQTVVTELVCKGDIAGAATFILERGGANADMVERIIEAQRKCPAESKR